MCRCIRFEPVIKAGLLHAVGDSGSAIGALGRLAIVNVVDMSRIGACEREKPYVAMTLGHFMECRQQGFVIAINFKLTIWKIFA